MIYLFVFLYSLFLLVHFDLHKNTRGAKFHYIFLHKNTRGAKFHYILLLIILILVAGLRYRVGGDTINYIKWYESFPDIYHIDMFFAVKFQPLSLLYFSLCKTISDDFTFLQIVTAVFVNTTLFWFFKKYTKYYFTAAFLFCIMLFLRFNMEAVRESIAIAFFLIAFPYAERGNWGKYYLFAIIAVLFHVSAVICLIYPFVNSKRNKKLIILAFIAFIAFMFAIDYGKSLISTDAIDFYVSTYEYQKRTFYGYIQNILNIVLFIPMWVYLGKKVQIYNSTYRAYFIIYAIVQVSMFFSSIGYRIGNYFLPIFILFLSDLLNELLKRKKQLVLAPLLYLAVLFYTTTPYITTYWDIFPGTNNKRYHVIYPYYSVFDKKEDPIRESMTN